MKKTNKLYGYVLLDEENVPFAIDGFVGRIFIGKTGFLFGEQANIPSILYGVTEQNYNIALKIFNPQIKINCIIFGITYYSIGTANVLTYDLSLFNRIEFIGGVGNSIFDPTKIYMPYEWENNIYENGCSIKFRPIKETEACYNITVHNTEIVFKSYINPYQDKKGNNLGVTNSVIALIFKSSQLFENIIQWYDFVTKIASLLVQQQNIEFETIRYYFGDGKNRGCANIFVNHGFNDIVEKSPIRTISLRCFDKIFDNFSKIIENEDFSIGFLPSNNHEAKFITYDTIKNICTAVEFEFQKSKIKKQKDSIIKNLIQEVNTLLKEYKEKTPELSEKAFNTISSSISNWTFPATEQFYALYDASKEVIDKLSRQHHIELNEEVIQGFVKCRNDITHGKKPSLNSTIADTAYALIILIYVSLFKRIGLNDGEIYSALEMIF